MAIQNYTAGQIFRSALRCSVNQAELFLLNKRTHYFTKWHSIHNKEDTLHHRRGGRYIDYDESISTLVFGYDVGDISEYPLTALGVEALFSNYIEGVWHSTDTIWDFTLYDLHITQARYENYRGNGYLSFDFYGDWEPFCCYCISLYLEWQYKTTPQGRFSGLPCGVL